MREAFIILVLLIALDCAWLSLAGGAYGTVVGRVQRGVSMNVRWVPAIVAYALMFLSIYAVVFPWSSLVIAAADDKGLYKSLATVAGRAFIVGLCIYGIFNATNLAIFSRYELRLALMDTAWGCSLYVIASTLAWWLSKHAWA